MRQVVPFPAGVIIDRHGFTWATLPPKTTIFAARIVGTCSVDALTLIVEQVRIDRAERGWNLLRTGQPKPFPLDRGLVLEVHGIEKSDPRVWSTVDVPLQVTVHVRDVSSFEDRFAQVPVEAITFRLSLLVHGGEPPS